MRNRVCPSPIRKPGHGPSQVHRATAARKHTAMGEHAFSPFAAPEAVALVYRLDGSTSSMPMATTPKASRSGG